jgi:hypothetical protein
MDNLFRKYKVLIIPTNGGWGMSNTGSGVVSPNPLHLYVATGTTANSRGLGFSPIFGLNSGTISRHYIDWTKRLEFIFELARINSDSESIARVQLKETGVEGMLAQRGIGLEIDNYTLIGEAYGTARGTVSLGTLTDNIIKRIKIVKDTEVQFWVDGVLVGTLTGDYVPNVPGTTGAYLVISIINGATGGVDARLYVGDIKIIQEW